MSDIPIIVLVNTVSLLNQDAVHILQLHISYVLYCDNYVLS